MELNILQQISNEISKLKTRKAVDESLPLGYYDSIPPVNFEQEMKKFREAINWVLQTPNTTERAGAIDSAINMLFEKIFKCCYDECEGMTEKERHGVVAMDRQIMHFKKDALASITEFLNIETANNHYAGMDKVKDIEKATNMINALEDAGNFAITPFSTNTSAGLTNNLSNELFDSLKADMPEVCEPFADEILTAVMDNAKNRADIINYQNRPKEGDKETF